MTSPERLAVGTGYPMTEPITYPSGQSGWLPLPDGWRVERAQFTNDPDLGSFDGYWVNEDYSEPIPYQHMDGSPAEPPVGLRRASIDRDSMTVNQWPITHAMADTLNDIREWVQCLLSEHKHSDVQDYDEFWRRTCPCGGYWRVRYDPTGASWWQHYDPKGRLLPVQEYQELEA